MCADRRRPNPPAPDTEALRDAVRAALEAKSGASTPPTGTIPPGRARSGSARPARGRSAGRGFRPVPRRTG